MTFAGGFSRDKKSKESRKKWIGIEEHHMDTDWQELKRKNEVCKCN